MDFASAVIETAKNNAVVNKFDYIKDDLLYCGKCHTQKQCKIVIWEVEHIVPCVCECEAQEIEQKEQLEKQAKQNIYIRSLKTNGIQDKQISDWTFENDNGSNPQNMAKMKRYFNKWDSMYSKNVGLLLWGGVGSGKSYSACCIANALLNNGIPALVTSFTKIMNDLIGFEVKDKNAYVNSFNSYKLLVIDDLGTERDTPTANEIVFNIIDSRYKNGQPLIITTNLTLDELKSPNNIKYSRIYDRVLEMCVPLMFQGESLRKSAYSEKLEMAKELLK